jgi:hypothetical protein
MELTTCQNPYIDDAMHNKEVLQIIIWALMPEGVQ